MAITPRTAGAWAAGSTSIAPALPASIAAGDIMVLFVGCKPFDASIGTPTDWNLLSAGSGANGAVANGTDSGSVLWATFWRTFATGVSAPTVSITSGNVSLGCINGFTKEWWETWSTPEAGKGSDTSSGTGYSITSDVNVQITSGDYVLHGSVIAGNNSTFGTPTLTATSATIGALTESPATEGSTATGLDLEASCAYAACTAGTSSAAAVGGWTLSVAQTGGGSITRLRASLPTQSQPTVVVLPPQPINRPI